MKIFITVHEFRTSSQTLLRETENETFSISLQNETLKFELKKKQYLQN